MAITLGQRLRQLRHERGLRLADLAPAIGISISYLNDLEHDRVTPSFDTFVRIGIGLDMQPVDVLRGVPPYDIADTEDD